MQDEYPSLALGLGTIYEGKVQVQLVFTFPGIISLESISPDLQ
jgi:hypothetical protein